MEVAGQKIQLSYGVEPGIRFAVILDGKGDAKDIIEEVNDFDDQTYVDLISDWRGVLDEDKAEVPFSRDMLVLALKQPLVRQAITKSYEEMASGEIRRKN